MTSKVHFVYVLRCSDGTLYTGYATDVKRRVKEHNGAGRVSGARYTRGRRPVTLAYYEEYSSRSTAMKREAIIKNLSREEKLSLINQQSNRV